MNNGVGVAPIEDLLRAGIKVGIGTDGFSHTMWEEWKTAYLLHKVWHRDPRRFSGIDAVELGVYNNAALANKFFKNELLIWSEAVISKREITAVTLPSLPPLKNKIIHNIT